MKQIAIYGKGGIGKSTISANISAALALARQRVLQIGCDPKHDSTRLLTGGTKITTVLDYLKVTAPDDWSLDDILATGFEGVSCVEAGGPEPGVGCAGRGILTTFDLLEKLGVGGLDYDLVLYDVLGDVVCGGFAVPLRHRYADAVYIVTSGEYMSIYAANNILRGLKNYDGDLKRAGGLIFNQRGLADEEGRLERFAWAVELPVLATFPRSDEFARAEEQGLTLVEKYPASEIAHKFKDLAAGIRRAGELYRASPLTDPELEEVVLKKHQPGNKPHVHGLKGRKEDRDSDRRRLPVAPETNRDEIPRRRFLSKNVSMGEPLHGCAFNGAVNITAQIGDALTLAHGPRNCAHISYQTITSVGRKAFYERGLLLPLQLSPPLVSSDMSEGVMVFGGLEELKDKIEGLKEYRPGAIFVVTTCPAGIIGDYTDALRSINGADGTRVIPIETDGNITGDYLQGVITACTEIARRLIKRDVPPEENLVNIIAEKPIAGNTETNLKTVRELLRTLGVAVNCRFICNTSVPDIENFLKAKINILAYEDYLGRMMRDFLRWEYGVEFLRYPFPVGFSDTRRWLAEVAACFGKPDRVGDAVAEHRERYRSGLEELRPLLAGKRLLVITYNHTIDWIIETALDLHMEIVKVCILNYSQDNLFQTRFENCFPVEEGYDPGQRERDIETLRPDLVLSNYASTAPAGAACTDTIPLCPDAGFFSGLALARRWAGLLNRNSREGWKMDAALFAKYNA